MLAHGELLDVAYGVAFFLQARLFLPQPDVVNRESKEIILAEGLGVLALLYEERDGQLFFPENIT